MHNKQEIDIALKPTDVPGKVGNRPHKLTKHIKLHFNHYFFFPGLMRLHQYPDNKGETLKKRKKKEEKKKLADARERGCDFSINSIRVTL